MWKYINEILSISILQVYVWRIISFSWNTEYVKTQIIKKITSYIISYNIPSHVPYTSTLLLYNTDFYILIEVKYTPWNMQCV